MSEAVRTARMRMAESTEQRKKNQGVSTGIASIQRQAGEGDRVPVYAEGAGSVARRSAASARGAAAPTGLVRLSSGIQRRRKRSNEVPDMDAVSATGEFRRDFHAFLGRAPSLRRRCPRRRGWRRMAVIPGVVLAGGKSSRMGGDDKAFKALGGRPALRYPLEALRRQCVAVAINANRAPERYAEFAAPVVADPVPGQPGPLAGILAAMLWARENGWKRVLTAPCDAPFLPPDLARRLAEVSGRAGRPAIVATAGRDGPVTHPATGLWPTRLAEDLAAALEAGDRKVRNWAGRHDPALAVFPESDATAFSNLNAPEDWEAAEARLRNGEAVGG